MSNLERRTLKSKVASSDNYENLSVNSLPERVDKLKIVDSGKPNTYSSWSQQNDNGPRRVVKPENVNFDESFDWSQINKIGSKSVAKPEIADSGKPSVSGYWSQRNENGPKCVVNPVNVDSDKPRISGFWPLPFGQRPDGNDETDSMSADQQDALDFSVHPKKMTSDNLQSLQLSWDQVQGSSRGPNKEGDESWKRFRIDSWARSVSGAPMLETFKKEEEEAEEDGASSSDAHLRSAADMRNVELSAPTFTIGNVPESAPRRRRSSKVATPDQNKDSKYYERRRKNNASAKKSRDIKKQKVSKIEEETMFLEKECFILKTTVEALRIEAQALRQQLVERQLFESLMVAELRRRALEGVEHGGPHLE